MIHPFTRFPHFYWKENLLLYYALWAMRGLIQSMNVQKALKALYDVIMFIKRGIPTLTLFLSSDTKRSPLKFADFYTD